LIEQIPKKLFYKIGEVCDICEIQPHVLRYWETEFSQLSPSKNSSGQRVYRYRDLQLVQRIKQLLYQEGYTIAGANRKLSGEGFGASVSDSQNEAGGLEENEGGPNAALPFARYESGSGPSASGARPEQAHRPVDSSQLLDYIRSELQEILHLLSSEE